MLRTNHQIGKELTKYYTFTGKRMSAKAGKELGIIAAVVEMEQIEATVEALVKQGESDKYATREIPEAYREWITAFSDQNVARHLRGELVQGVSSELATQLDKIISTKGIIALETMNSLIDQQSNMTIDEGIELELAGLTAIFKTEDALSGLLATLSGQRPTFKTKIGGRIA